MFNRTEIMKAAWSHYRKAIAYVTSNPYLAGTVVRFGDCLKEEWRRAKADVATAAQVAKVSAAVAEQVAALKGAIRNLDYKSFRYNIGHERRALHSKLEALAG